ncbi:MAG: helix-turn-helix domain-containing protein [bacterium]
MDKLSLLEKAVEAISKLSGMGICIYDMSYFSYQISELSLHWSYKSHNSPVCILTKLDDGRHKVCIMIEHNRLYKAMNQKEGFCIEKCYGGLVDIAIPIKLGNKLIGGIFIGQVFLEEAPPFSLYEDLFGKDKNIDLNDIKREVDNIPIKSYKELLYWAEIGKILATFIAREVEFFELKNKDKDLYYISKLDHLLGVSEPIQKAINIIKQRSTKGIRLEEVALAVGYSPTYFSKVFKKEVEMSFTEAVRLVRIELAQYLIKNSDRSVCEIAYEVGYADFPSFVRAFKKVTNMTPREYLFHHVPII